MLPQKLSTVYLLKKCSTRKIPIFKQRKQDLTLSQQRVLLKSSTLLLTRRTSKKKLENLTRFTKIQDFIDRLPHYSKDHASKSYTS